MIRSTILKKLEKTDFQKICRLCLKEGVHLKQIFSTNKTPNMIDYCSDIMISDIDNLPKHICMLCLRQVTKLYTFKKKIERNNKILKVLVKNKSNSRDIINIAINNLNLKNTKENNELSEEDVPLSERVAKLKELNVKSQENNGYSTNRVKIEHIDRLKIQHIDIQEFIRCNEIKTIDPKHSRILNYNFGYEPPPLVPLDSSTDLKEDTFDDNLQNLSTTTDFSLVSSDSPPPLIPINSGKVDMKLLENVIEQPNLKFVCSSCKQEFTSVLLLREHKLTQCKTNSLECTVCKKQFKDRKKLIVHLKGHTLSKNYVCRMCGKQYPTPSAFRVHFRTHTGEKPCKCTVCGKGFIRWAAVKNHMKTHQNVKPFKCDTCGKGFKVASNLRRHKVLHTGLYSYCCNYCGKFFSQADHLKVHIRLHHTDDRPYLCSECGKSFVSSTRLKRHSWIHSGYRPYTCTFCSKAYRNTSDLRSHQQKLHSKNKDDGKKYICQYCDHRFWHPCRLQKHLRTHEHVEIVCSTCGSAFKSKLAINRHKKNKECKSVVEVLEETMVIDEVFIAEKSEEFI